MRYLVTKELHSFNIWIFSNNLLVVKERTKFYIQFYNKYTLSVSLSESVQFRHLYRKLYYRNWRNLLRKGRIKSPCVSLECAIEFSFCGRKTRFTHAIAANKRANSHNFKIKNLNLLTITFLAVYLVNRGKSSYMNESSMRVNNTFR